MSPYRSAPPVQRRAPKTPWHRLAWALVRGLSRRLEVRKIRHGINRDLVDVDWIHAHWAADQYPRESGAVLGLYVGHRQIQAKIRALQNKVDRLAGAT